MVREPRLRNEKTLFASTTSRALVYAMNTTKPMHKILSTVITEQLKDLPWNLRSCTRYLTREVLAKYSIRYETPVTVYDWNIALELAKEQRMKEIQEPLHEPEQSRLPASYVLRCSVCGKTGRGVYRQFYTDPQDRRVKSVCLCPDCEPPFASNGTR